MARAQGGQAALFLLPYGLVFLLFVVAPAFYGLYISLHKWHILARHAPFVGLENYRLALQDDLLRIAFARTVFFVAMVVPAGNALSLLLAVGLAQEYRGTTIYKLAYYSPVVTSVAVVAIIWRWLLSAEWGLLNHYLSELARLANSVAPSLVPSSTVRIPWLTSPVSAMPAIALMSIWWGAGGNMLVYLAGLKQIPRELLEAAEIDGAGPVQRFWRITWPLLRPTTLFCLVMSVIGASQVFGQTYILTGGGPYYSTLTVVLYMYQQGFGLYQLGYACAVAYILFAAVLVFTLLQFRLLAVRAS